MKKSIQILFIPIILFLAACSEEKDSSEFVRVYGDVLTQRLSHKNSIEATHAVDSVLEANGYTLESFGAALEEFSKSDPDFTLIIDSLRTAISDKAAKLDSLEQERISTEKAARDSSSVNEEIPTEEE